MQKEIERQKALNFCSPKKIRQDVEKLKEIKNKMLENLHIVRDAVRNKEDTNRYTINFLKYDSKKIDGAVYKTLAEPFNGGKNFTLVFYKNGILLLRDTDNVSCFYKLGFTDDTISKVNKVLGSTIKSVKGEGDIVSQVIKGACVFIFYAGCAVVDKATSSSFTDCITISNVRVLDKMGLEYKALPNLKISNELLKRHNLQFYNINELCGTFDLKENAVYKMIDLLKREAEDFVIAKELLNQNPKIVKHVKQDEVEKIKGAGKNIALLTKELDEMDLVNKKTNFIIDNRNHKVISTGLTKLVQNTNRIRLGADNSELLSFDQSKLRFKNSSTPNSSTPNLSNQEMGARSQKLSLQSLSPSSQTSIRQVDFGNKTPSSLFQYTGSALNYFKSL